MRIKSNFYWVPDGDDGKRVSFEHIKLIPGTTKVVVLNELVHLPALKEYPSIQDWQFDASVHLIQFKGQLWQPSKVLLTFLSA